MCSSVLACLRVAVFARLEGFDDQLLGGSGDKMHGGSGADQYEIDWSIKYQVKF